MTVLFLHVPKAAGTSYARALADGLGGTSMMVPIPRELTSEEFQQVDPETLRPYAFVGAHVDYGLVRRAPWLRVATVLRDPVDRIVSWYHYVCRDEGETLAPWRRLIQDRHLSIEDFLVHPQLRWLHGQAQTMQIAGYLWSGDPLPHVDRLVGTAAENLAACAHVGLFERLGDSLRLAQRELGLPTVPLLPDENVSPPRPDELDPEVRTRVGELLGMDSAFYPLAVAEFERRLERHGLAGEHTELPPPVRPPAVVTAVGVGGDAPHRTVEVDAGHGAARDGGRDAVGDWIDIAWSPEPGTTIGGPLVWPLPLSAPPADAEVTSLGTTFRVADDAPLDLGANWVGLPAGLYHVQATVPCRRFESDEEAPWDVLFDFAWYDDPPIPYVEGLPGAPDETLWIPLPVPVGLPKLPLRGAPVSGSGVIRVPRGGGHLALLLGSTLPVALSPGDQVRLRYVRVG